MPSNRPAISLTTIFTTARSSRASPASVARMLGLPHPQSLHRRLQPHETQRIHLRYATESEEPVDVINEAGLYKALVRFGHPESLHLDSWLTREVIPTLRDQYAPDGPAPRRVMMRWQQRQMMLLEWQGELWVSWDEMPKLVQSEGHHDSRWTRCNESYLPYSA